MLSDAHVKRVGVALELVELGGVDLVDVDVATKETRRRDGVGSDRSTDTRLQNRVICFCGNALEDAVQQLAE
jgi:hypothetical protein